jgi:oligopeptide/dipeptide ABC transporter ATP-binding protein
MTDDILLDVAGLCTEIVTDHGTLRAVDNVSLQVRRGEAVALVGESGCGKSMTALSLMRLLRPPLRIGGGQVRLEGEDLTRLSEAAMRRLRGGRLAMIFQDPMTFLNPLMRIGAQIGEAIRMHRPGLGRGAVRQAVLDALRQVRIPAPEAVIDRYPHQISGGMRQRVLIATAIACRPTLLIADEPTTALDVTVQAQIMRLLSDLRRELGSAMLLITHDLGLVAGYCDRVLVMYAGQIVEEGEVHALFRAPQHPYTRALLRSTLPLHRRIEQFQTIDGYPPDLFHPPYGCHFHARCPDGFDRCASKPPPLTRTASGGASRCWLTETPA